MIATSAFIVLVFTLLIQIAFFFIRKIRDPISHWLQLAASLLLFLATVLRSREIGFFAITNTFESLLFFSGMITLICKS